MSPRRMLTCGCLAATVCLCAAPVRCLAQDSLAFTDVQVLTNREALLRLTGATSVVYRIDAATTLPHWQPLVSIATNRTPIVHADSAAPFLPQRFYRAQPVTDTNLVTGDYLATADGEVVIHPIAHATMALAWNTNIIYVDPAQNQAALFRGLPAPQLILVTHDHTDHFDVTTISTVRGANTLILAPKAVFQRLPASLTNSATILTNGAVATVLGLTIQAVPAYNANHPKGTGNGYVLSDGNRHLYISGDTGNIAELSQLGTIDVAFVCCDGVYTMNVDQAAQLVRTIRPGVAYAYHYLTADVTRFKRLVGQDLGIEVRLRKWE